MCSAFIAQNLSWRWVFYVQSITCGSLILLVALFFKETRGSVLLSRKAHVLNQWYERREQAGYVGFEMQSEDGQRKEKQRIRWKVKSDEERETLRKMIGISLCRPFCKPVTLWVILKPNVLILVQFSFSQNQLSSFSHYGSLSVGLYSTCLWLVSLWFLASAMGSIYNNQEPFLLVGYSISYPESCDPSNDGWFHNSDSLMCFVDLIDLMLTVAQQFAAAPFYQRS